MIFDLRPGEVAIHSYKKQLIDIGLREGLGTTRYLAALEPNVPIILTKEQWAHVSKQGYSELETVQTDRAELPTLLDTSDKVALSLFTTGEPPKDTLRNRTETISRKFNLDPRPAECAVHLIDAGMSEWDAVRAMRTAYEEAQKNHQGFREPWVARMNELLKGVKV